VMTVSVCLSLCLSVCSRAYLQNLSSDLLRFLCVLPWPWLSLALPVLRYLCTSSFVDDIIFAHTGPYAGVPA